MMEKDKNKEKEHQDGETMASSETITSPWDACQSNRDLSWDWETRDATLAKTIAEAVAREMAKVHAQYQALLNDRSTAAIQTSLKVTSGANGFKVMDPFDWTKDKTIYQRWQLWSEKARLTLDAMEGDYAIFLGMNSQWARDKAINLMNEEGKELTVEFLMNQLAVEDYNAHHKSLSQLDSTSSVNFAAYGHRQNKGKSNKSK